MTTRARFLPSLIKCCALCGLLAVPAAFANDDEDISEQVILPECEGGDSCVMLFGKVGEVFEVQIDEPDQYSRKDCSAGYGVRGELCSPPKGIKLDSKNGILKGVPREAGFHEFVLLVSEKGVTRERVYLIDIEGAGVDPMHDSYASLYVGPAR